jgi:tetratricopeptide (TPR) repeat protein
VTPGLGAARLVRLGRGGELDLLLAEMRHRIGERHNALEQVFLHFSVTSARVRRGDVSGALEHGRQALEWAIQSQNMVVRAAGHVARGWRLLAAGRSDEALEQLEQALEIAIDRDVMKGLAVNMGLPFLAATQLRRGDLAAARAAAERGIELARVMGYRHGEATNLVSLSHVQVAAGDLAAADVTLVRAAELAKALSARDLPPCIEEARAELARVRGDGPAAERLLRGAAELHRANGEEWLATQAEARIGSESQSPP